MYLVEGNNEIGVVKWKWKEGGRLRREVQS